MHENIDIKLANKAVVEIAFDVKNFSSELSRFLLEEHTLSLVEQLTE